MVYLKKADYEKILAHGRAGFPNEACGLIAGHIAGEDKRIEAVYLLENLDQSPEHFTMDPKEQLAALKEARGQGLSLLGNFHSHPETPSRPSQEDIRLAYDSSASYLILSLAEAEPVLNSFHIEKQTVTKESLVIE